MVEFGVCWENYEVGGLDFKMNSLVGKVRVVLVSFAGISISVGFEIFVFGWVGEG